MVMENEVNFYTAPNFRQVNKQALCCNCTHLHSSGLCRKYRIVVRKTNEYVCDSWE
jgi:hypothetical protein